MTAFAGYASTTGWSVRAAVGVLVDGSLEGEEMPGTHDLRPGVLVALGVARQWTLGGHWFVTGTGALSAASASTRMSGVAEGPRFTAGDVRVGVIAGRIIGGIWQPYLLARGFAGPVWWSIAGNDLTGTDMHHYQLGAGLSVATTFGLSIVVDASLLGEQGVSLGVSWRL